MVQRYVDSDGNGIADSAVGGLIDPDDVKSIWRAGKLLWSRNISSSPRNIMTTINGTSLLDFSSSLFPGGAVASNAAILAPYLNVDATAASNLINWVHGQDSAAFRNRTVDIKDPVTGVISTGVWRLGDIISSTPRVQSTVRLNTYNLASPGGYSDSSYDSFTNSTDYKGRGMVYVGGNDGMLHAFNLGVLSVKSTGFQKATLTGTELGKEIWAYIPRSALPYLQYMADTDYEHLYYVDGRTVIFDASIGDTNSGDCVKATYWKCSKPRSGAGAIVVDSTGSLDPAKNTWRSIVISGMGSGGATTKNCAAGSNCVQTPLADPDDSSKGLGYSSYFALDVTDPVHPQLLWEFSHPELGYSTTGPAVVRLGDREKNGRWLAIFGSGSTGPIDTSTHQFKGSSSQSLKYFVVDLRTGALVHVGGANDYIDTGISNAFSGTLLGASIDVDRWDTSAVGNYQDDAVYVGYAKEATAGSGVLTDGGIGRIMIDPMPIGTEPSDTNIRDRFHWSTVLDGTGPVTTAVSRLQSRNPLNKNLWLFFGTGRYFYRAGAVLDDYSTRRALYAVKEPCYNKLGIGNYLDHSCSDPQSATIVNQTSSVSTVSDSHGGWKIDLDPSTTAEAAERVVTDTVALTNGTVFFTSFKPTTDVCGYGGNSFLWGVKYDTGGQAAASALVGKALIQLSTGEFKEVDLSSAFNDAGTLNRRMATPMTGKPPSDAPPIISSSQNRPLKKILHIQEH
jgi:type IV pilus assembly protein PilY1